MVSTWDRLIQQADRYAPVTMAGVDARGDILDG
jgi:hypothetical protein